jgi:2-dehydro-3-deoxyphosphooctonate aldolase (KDO 8-P synthase)
MIAGTMMEACAAADAQYVRKACYDKANRTSLSDLRSKMGVTVLTDVHSEAQFKDTAAVCMESHQDPDNAPATVQI